MSATDGIRYDVRDRVSVRVHIRSRVGWERRRVQVREQRAARILDVRRRRPDVPSRHQRTRNERTRTDDVPPPPPPVLRARDTDEDDEQVNNEEISDLDLEE